MMVYIHNENEAEYWLPEERLRASIAFLLAAHGREGSELSLAFCDDEQLCRLNRQFRGEAWVTDVLSFPAGDAGPYLGDIVIAYPHARALAESSGQQPAEMLILLAVHGTLHLLGYEHEEEVARAEMWRAQAAALEAMGIDEDNLRAALAKPLP